MFDIGALELVLIGVVALIVLGPERLPKVARTAGFWLGRARRAFLSVKEEIDREIKAEELKEILRKQAESNPLETILEEDGSVKPKVDGKAVPSPSRSTTASGGSGASTAGGSARTTTPPAGNDGGDSA
jgi:sec-independent protein translocase protein TatB